MNETEDAGTAAKRLIESVPWSGALRDYDDELAQQQRVLRRLIIINRLLWVLLWIVYPVAFIVFLVWLIIGGGWAVLF